MIMERDSLADVNAFEALLCPYVHGMHYDFRYLLEQNELEITKRYHPYAQERLINSFFASFFCYQLLCNQRQGKI